MEITGHVIGTDWTVFHKLPAEGLHAVKIWLVVWVLVRERGTASRYERLLRIYEQLSRGGPPVWEIVVGASNSYPNNLQCVKTFHKSSDLG